MEPFVKATYNLEGDGFLALEVYEQLSALYIAITSKHMPNVKATAKAEPGGNSLREQQLLDYAEVCVTPAYDYLACNRTEQNSTTMILQMRMKRYNFLSYTNGSITCSNAARFELHPPQQNTNCSRAVRAAAPAQSEESAILVT